MKKCFVTVLQKATGNNKLLRVGEARVEIKSIQSPTYGTQYCTIAFENDSKVEIEGDGYFTDYNLTENQGKTKEITGGSLQSFRLSNGNYELAILNKYDMTVLNISGEGRAVDLASLFCPKMSDLKIGDKAFGDIASLATMGNIQKVSITGEDIYGDCVVFKDLESLEFISLTCEKLTSKLSNFENNVSLRELYLDIQLTGDLSSLYNLSSLTATHLRGNFNGDIAKMPSSLVYLQVNNNNNTLTWSERPSSASIIGLSSRIKIDNIDKMLENQAKCVAYTGSTPWYKVISAIGTRTSVSDEAVATLQSKGYTVSINPV